MVTHSCIPTWTSRRMSLFHKGRHCMVGILKLATPWDSCFQSSSVAKENILPNLLRWQEIHLPPYRGEIPTPPAPSYLQVKQSEAMKRSPLRAVMPNAAVESPKTKCSGGKGGHHHSSVRGSNTSTPKHPDSTSAKKPSSSKEPVPKEQDKSPRSCSSCKHGCSPYPSAESDGCKQKEACTEDTCKLTHQLQRV